MIAAMAWRNLWRQPQRTILSIFSIAFAAALLVFMLSFQLGVYSVMTTNMLRLFDGFAQLRPPGYSDDPDMRKTIARPERLASELRSLTGVRSAAPRIAAFAILAHAGRSYGAAVIGVDPAREPAVSSLASTVRTGRYLAASDEDAVVVGAALARDLKLSLGDRVTLLGSQRDGSVATDVLHVVGIFRSGDTDLDRQMAEMPLARAQATFGLGDRANTIAMAGRSLGELDEALPAIAKIAARHGERVADWEELEPSLRDSIALKMITSSLMYATLVVIVVFIILNTLLMSVLERTREFGVLLALGMRPGLLGEMVWLELIGLALVGNGLGIGVGALVTMWFERHGIVYPGLANVLAQFGLPERLYPELGLLSALAGPGAMAFAIGAAGAVPYFHIQRLEAVSAMRAA